MRFISWNVNGIRAAHNKGELSTLLQSFDPDFLFMQEIKAQEDRLPESLRKPEEYEAFYNPAEKPGYAGTGVWIHKRAKKYIHSIQTGFFWDPTANEWRVVHVEIAREGKSIPLLHVFGVYFPNGGKSEQAWQEKLIFYKEFGRTMDMLRTQWCDVLWWGDLNCAHHEKDLARPRENDGKIGFHPMERAWLDERVAEGWVDIWREENPDVTDTYSWWDPVTRARQRNVWWRIDAWWWNSTIREKVRNVEYLWSQMGSDHCPILIDIDHEIDEIRYARKTEKW